MSILPTSIGNQVNVPYYGWGSSNQTSVNSIPALNLGPGLSEPNLQSNLYVPDLQVDVTEINQEIKDDDGGYGKNLALIYDLNQLKKPKYVRFHVKFHEKDEKNKKCRNRRGA